jgi:hypothetical protein
MVWKEPYQYQPLVFDAVVQFRLFWTFVVYINSDSIKFINSYGQLFRLHKRVPAQEASQGK